MLGINDPELEWYLDNEVNDLARYNILRYLHDHPGIEGSLQFFADQLGLRSMERTQDDLSALVRCGLLEMISSEDKGGGVRYRLSPDPRSRVVVDRLSNLSQSREYGELVERLASRSLRRVRKAIAAARSRHSGAAAGQ